MEPLVSRISFTAPAVAEIEFGDGRQVVITGPLAATLREYVQDDVRRCFAEARRAGGGAEEN